MRFAALALTLGLCAALPAAAAPAESAKAPAKAAPAAAKYDEAKLKELEAKLAKTPKDAKLRAEYEEYLKKRLAELKKQRGEN